VIFAVVVSILSGFILSLPIWQIQKVVVTGNVYITEDKIINTAKVPLSENLFLVDLDEVKAKFSKVVQIKSIKIKRRLPATVVIEVVERKPFAIAVIGHATTLIDDDGYIIARQSLISSLYQLNVADYPVIRGIDIKSLEGGKRLNESDRRFVKDALQMFGRFIALNQVQLEVGRRDDMVVFLQDVIRVKIGDSNDIEKKIKVTKALLDSVQGKIDKVAYIDVRIPDDPVVKFR
jgi:cell division protein FtsQ